MNNQKSLISTLSNPLIRDFIDFRKLIKSQQMNAVAEFCTGHFIEHGDRTYIDKVIDAFKETKYFPVLLEWFCLSAGLEAKIEKDVLLLKKSPLGQNQRNPFSVTLNEYISSKIRSKNIWENKMSETPEKAKHKKRLKKIDMLDSRARLPGSFESGKRR